MILLITIATFCSTLLGGVFALYLRDRLHLVLGFSAGAILGVTFFDLLPESLELAGGAYSAPTVFAVVAAGFAAYLVVDRFTLTHNHAGSHDHADPRRGNAGAGGLSFHSFLDGAGIGLAFQASPVVGAIVAAAVLTHDFSDGINTVSLVLKNGGTRAHAFRWLLVDALAPVAGVVSTRFFTMPQEQLGLMLALFAGFFLYLGASDLVPESYHNHPKRLTTCMTLAGIITLYVVIRLAGA